METSPPPEVLIEVGRLILYAVTGLVMIALWDRWEQTRPKRKDWWRK